MTMSDWESLYSTGDWAKRDVKATRGEENKMDDSRRQLASKLTDMFMLYEYGRQTPLATIEEYSRAPHMAREAYIHDPILNARVQHLVMHVLSIVDNEIRGAVNSTLDQALNEGDGVYRP
jgi:hypothetical protein